MKVLISGGGTGGHYFVARAFGQLLEKEYQVIYVTTKNKLDAQLIQNDGVSYYQLPATGFSGNIIKKIKAIINLIKSINQVKKIIKKEQIDVVISCGGYLGVALIWGGKKTIKFLHEQNAIPGLATKICAKKVAYAFTSFPTTKIKNHFYLGNPRGTTVLNQQYNRPLYLQNYKKIITVFSGSLGAMKINEIIAEFVSKYQQYQVVLVTGKRYFQQYQHLNATVLDFVADPASLIKFSDLVIARAGATMISEIKALKTKALLIPSPNVTANHQYFNAVASGYPLILEADLTLNNLYKAITDLMENDVQIQSDNNRSSEIVNIIKQVVNDGRA